MSLINPQAVIDPSAEIASDVRIGPWTQIGPNVVIDSGCEIGSHVVISKNTRLGKNNKIFQYASVGADPQSITYRGEETWLEIGDNNVIREFTTLHRSASAGGKTRIGNHNFIMAYVHIAHDCIVGDHVIFANLASIAGHVTIGNHVGLGAFTGIHQFVTIGDYSFLGRATKIFNDILPYTLVTGNPGVPTGINSVGLKRHGFSDQQLSPLKKAFRIIYRQGLNMQSVREQLSTLAQDSEETQQLLTAIEQSQRGIARSTSQIEVV